MKYSRMLEYVQLIGRFESGEDAGRAILAVSEVLARRLSPEGARKLASQLPREAASAMNSAPGHEIFGMQDFFSRVAEKLGVGPAEAMHHAEVVFGVLQDAAPVEIWERVFKELDPEYIKFINASAVTDKREGFFAGRARKFFGESGSSS